MNKKIFFIFITLLFLLLISVCILCIVLQKQEQVQPNFNLSVNSEKVKLTLEDIIKKYNSTYIKTENNIIYIKFAKDLFENGKSNKSYFEDMIEEMCKLDEFKERMLFYLIDESKNIKISIKYNFKTQEHEIIFNDKEEFFETTNGEIYSKISTAQIMEKVQLKPTSEELSTLIDGNMFFKEIKDTLGEGIDLGNGYISYKDNSILIKVFDGRVKSIIFTENYEGDVFSDIKVGTKISDILRKYEDCSRGSLYEGYALYRTSDIYAFFYEDEIIVYGYSYFENTMFEDFLENYLQNKDLKTFVEKVTKKWTNYEICEYDLNSQYAHITYPSRGVEINIINNDPKGITLYQNYYFTDRTKKFIMDEKISIENGIDYLEFVEKNRRNSMER